MGDRRSMSMSVSSASSDDLDTEPTLANQSAPSHASQLAGQNNAAASDPAAQSLADRLPPEIWQHVCSYMSPPMLGTMMKVNKRLMSCLDGSIPGGVKESNGVLRTVDHDALWALWRVAHVPNMPKPLIETSERDMWRLILGVRCEVCGKLDKSPPSLAPKDPFYAGPTRNTTRVIWQFQIRICGECLSTSCTKDTELLCTEAGPFVKALPFAFMASDAQYILTPIMTDGYPIPVGRGPVYKQYFTRHATQVLEQWRAVQSLGREAESNWSQGMPSLGKKTMQDAARWEHWEIKGGLNRVHLLLTPQQQLPPPPPLVQPPVSMAKANAPYPWGIIHQPQPVSLAQAPFSQLQPTVAPTHYLQTSPISSTPNPFPQPVPASTPQGQILDAFGRPANLPPTPQHRNERSLRDAQEAKSIRRNVIEQRCLTDMDPPLPPSVLRHMEAFKAAIQIAAPFNESYWDMLKPRLEAQRAGAEQLEREHTQQLLALQAHVDAHTRRSANSKEVKEAQERLWEDALKPQREKLSTYADRFVQQQWKSGHAVNSGNVARFAIAVFNQVRSQFYKEQEESDNVSRLRGQPIADDPPNGPFLRRLTLETMKWVYDHKIRPHIRDFGKEIFFCSDKGCEGNSKLYAFEGAIQHFGAKHTNDFSKGNVVVHWQSADWPEYLPFFDPGSGTAQSNHRTNGGFSRGATVSPRFISSAPFNVPSLTTSPYTPLSHGNGPFNPPGASTNGFSPQNQYSGNQASATTAGAAPSSAPKPFDPSDLSQYFKPALSIPQASATAAPAGETAPIPANLQALLNSLAANPAAQGIPHRPATAGSKSAAAEVPEPMDRRSALLDTDVPDYAAYQDRLKFIADTARTRWNSLPSILDIPQSVRVFAVIHHTVSQFLSRFDVNLSIETFTDALTNNALLDPLKHADGLECHICSLETSAGLSPAHPSGPMDLSHLTAHFKAIHIDGAGLANADWATSMIALPGDETIIGLTTAPGINDERIAVLADAFPHLLPRRISRHKEDSRSKPRNGRRSTQKPSGRRGGSADFKDMDSDAHRFFSGGSSRKQYAEDGGVYYGSTRRSRTPPGSYHTPKLNNDSSAEEYDPHNPALPPDAGKRYRKRERPVEEYDPHNPALPPDAVSQYRQRDLKRKRSGAEADLAQLVQAADASALRAAEVEVARRGIGPGHVRTESNPMPQHEAAIPARLSPPPPPPYEEVPRRVQYASPGVYDREPRQRHYVDYRVDRNDDPARAPYPAEDYHEDRVLPRHHPTREHPDDDFIDDRHVRAPSARFARYAQEARLLRERSRSPIPLEDPGHPERSYQDLRERPPLPPKGRTPPVHYRYAEERERVYIDEHGVPYVRRRVEEMEPQYIGRVGEGAMEYGDRRPAYVLDERPVRYLDDDRLVRYPAPGLQYDPRSFSPQPHARPGRDARYE